MPHPGPYNEAPYGYCAVCDIPFTDDEWEDRHTDSADDDVHEQCCDICHRGGT